MAAVAASEGFLCAPLGRGATTTGRLAAIHTAFTLYDSVPLILDITYWNTGRGADVAQHTSPNSARGFDIMANNVYVLPFIISPTCPTIRRLLSSGFRIIIVRDDTQLMLFAVELMR